MKRVFLCLLLLLSLAACGELADMTSAQGEECGLILWEGRTYLPYCAVGKEQCGRQIGMVDGDENDRVCEYKGHPAEEWIVNIYVSGMMDGAMLYRESGVTDIPAGLESEYEWNNGAERE